MNIVAIRNIVAEAVDLMTRKDRDYGHQNITMTGLSGILVRLVDKAYRLDSLTNSGSAPNFESIRDTLMDIMNYGMIGLMVHDGTWDAKLPMRCVYLAGPIDAVTRADAMGWRDQVSGILARQDIATYNPCAAFAGGSLLTADVIDKINRTAIQSCDAVLARMTEKAPSVGTPREIEFAVSLRKPVVVWADNDQWKRHLAAYDIAMAFTAEDAVEFLLNGAMVVA